MAQQISESELVLMKIIWKNGGAALYSLIMEELEKDCGIPLLFLGSAGGRDSVGECLFLSIHCRRYCDSPNPIPTPSAMTRSSPKRKRISCWALARPATSPTSS